MDFKMENLARDLEVYQFFQVCKYFDVSIVNIKIDADDKELEKFDKEGVSFRKDFDNMEKEIYAKYVAMPRRNRRQIGKVIGKVVEANQKNRKKAVEEFKAKYKENYTAGAVSEIPNVDSEVEKVSTTDVSDNG